MVPFDVGCARCGHDLRGSTSPVCGACGLNFDWAQAVPVEALTCRTCGYHLYGLRETRCPECGEPFTWDQALDDYRRSRKPIFEYRWRQEPIRSLFRTWTLALRPRKLWSTIDLHDPPKMWPLFFLLVVSTLGITAATACFMILTSVTGYLEYMAFLRQNQMLGRVPITLWDFVNGPIILGTIRGVLLVLFVWWFWSIAALMIFQQSMRLGRVRTVHVLRVWILSTVALSSLASAVAVPMMAIELATLGTRFVRSDFVFALATCGLAYLILGIAAQVAAYRHFLRLPHAMGIVLAAQLIAVLATLTTNILIFLFG